MNFTLSPHNPMRKPGYRFFMLFAACSAMVGLFILGLLVHVVGILANTTLQREVSNEVMGRTMSSVQVCQYFFIPPTIWLLGRYASLPRGRLLHETPLRDAFVASALFFVALAVLSRFLPKKV